MDLPEGSPPRPGHRPAPRNPDPGRPFSCVLIGGNSLVVSCAELLLGHGHRVLGLVSPDAGIRDWARDHGLRALDFGPDLVPHLSETPFDHLFSIANLRMLPAELLGLPRGLPVNFHDGPLPRHAGLNATTWALLERETTHGVTWHVMTEGADEGDVLVRRPVTVTAEDTSHTLDVKCLEAGYASFAELVERLETGTLRRTPQDLSARTYHGRFDRPAGGGFLCWDQPAATLHAAVRAADHGPYPNSFGTVKFATADGAVLVGGLAPVPVPQPPGAPPGTVLGTEEGGVVVAVADGAVRLTGLTTPRGEPLTGAALGGYGVRPGRPLPVPGPELLAAATEAQSGTVRQEAYWVRRLAAVVPAELPGAGAPAPGGGVHEIPVPVPGDAAGAARRAGLPLDRWLLAAHLAFLVRAGVAEGSDVHWAVPRPGAGRPSVAALYAPFVPLRVPAADGTGPAAFAARAAAAADEATRRGTHPLDLWPRHPRLRERRPAAPGLPIAVEVCDDPTAPAAPADGTALLIRIPAGGTPGPCRWLVREGVLEPGVRTLLAGYATAFLAAAAGGDPADLTALPLGTEDRRRGARGDFTAPPPPAACVHQLVSRQAALRPDAPAVSCGGETLDYAELDRRSSALAGHLRARGIGPGHLVGVHLERSVRLPVALLGIMKSGAAYVPLDPVYPAERIAYMLQDTGLRLVVTESAPAARLPGGHAETLLLDRSWPEVAASAPEPGADVDGDQDAYVLYTSGSTGRPKGVRIPHRALTNLIDSVCRTPGMTEHDTLLAVTTVCFDIAGLELYAPLAAGGRVEVAPERAAADGPTLRDLIERVEPTVMQATPATWRMLLDAGWPRRPDAPVPRLLCGGEALPDDLARRLLALGAPLWNLYGPTETTIWSTVKRVRPAEPVTLGRPIARTTCHVVDRRLRPVPPGIPGELLIGGAGVARGYLNRPELTAQRFVPDTYGGPGDTVYRTGDLVRLRPDGDLEYLGRIDEQVKVNGYRIEPGEVEQALLLHPGVAEAVVTVREDRPGDRRLVAYLVTRAPGVRPGELRTRLLETLPAYMVPTAFVELDAIPLTGNGKTDRRALPRPAGAGGPRVAPADQLESSVAGLWREVLALDAVGAEDNFFEAGGTSLLLMRLMGRLNADLDAALSRVEMFMYPTVRSMARHLRARRSGRTGPGPAVPQPRAATGPSRTGLAALRRRRQQVRTADDTGR
ncbi:amino acid adenylation domain-containing protein [Streptomyces pactum]|uniref:Amino acid adenylation domain-containing protein n=1 Tax=Streptomyces pactum TaxID=68249 RepID=A0ABS0NS40_9ACTN|nr:amino acid adenylation domain-containing protein [Streptomyces pactum]MBH5338032.1 amino acid adenylation domain-containing protein [Streptomyces pactum]